MTGSALPRHAAALPSPIGRLVIIGTDQSVTEVNWSEATVETPAPSNSVVGEAKRQLAAYFDRRLQHFDVPMTPKGSGFQTKIWQALLAIPFGETASYGEIARQVDSAARAVGMACGANPIPVLIPCHRVVAANGRLTGYSGGDGIQTKQILLALEDSGQPDLFGISGACYDPRNAESQRRA